jgi:hypothetical protein
MPTSRDIKNPTIYRKVQATSELRYLYECGYYDHIQAINGLNWMRPGIIVKRNPD